jgi:hypothetical protein
VCYGANIGEVYLWHGFWQLQNGLPKPNFMKNTLIFRMFTLTTTLMAVVSPSFAQRADDLAIRKLTLQWNGAHNTRDMSILSELYGDTVRFYGMELDRNACLLKELEMLQTDKSFEQEISGPITVDPDRDDFKASFLKHVVSKGKTYDFPSYLLFAQRHGHFVIIAESDAVTDKNIAKKKAPLAKPPKNAVYGDFNGDGVREYMWLELPEISEGGMDCKSGDCTAYIRFSDPNIPSIAVKNCISGKPVNHGDLNGNGTDEVGLLPGWFTSAWRDYYVWTFKGGRWVYAVQPFLTHADQWEEGIVPIEKDLSHPGHVTIRYSEMGNNGPKVKVKSVEIVR